MKTYKFWIRRTYSGPLELIEIQAKDSHEAVNKIPPCVYWDFSTTKTTESERSS